MEVVSLPILNHTPAFLRRLAWRSTQRIHYDLGPKVGQNNAYRDPPSNFSSPDLSPEDRYLTPPFEPLAPFPERPVPTMTKPVLRGDEVDDYGQENFVADPFLWPGDDGTWHMFFEVYSPSKSPPGSIGHATSPDGLSWEYNRIVLNLETHLSFPYVFKYDDAIYMIPEEEPATQHQYVNLFRATEFPEEWTHETTLLSLDHANNDAVLFRWDSYWWLLVGEMRTEGIYAYYADDIRSTWRSHTNNPVVRDRPAAGRPGGRPVVYEDKLIVFYQDCEDIYGHQVRAYEITELNPETYEDRELDASPVLTPSAGRFGWNTGRMHHIDPWWTGRNWICAVDGNVSQRSRIQPWSISIYAYK